MNVINYFNPRDIGFAQAQQNYFDLEAWQKVVVVITSVVSAILTAFILCLGGVAVFRWAVEVFAVTENGGEADPAGQNPNSGGSVFQGIPQSSGILEPETPEKSEISAIDANFTTIKSIQEQRNAHKNAKQYLKEKLEGIGAEIFIVSPPPSQQPLPKVNEVEITNLDSDIFTWETTWGVQFDIPEDGKRDDSCVLYGVASQFNGCEAVRRFTPKPKTACQTYKYDLTQGPLAQLTFPPEQVEIINKGANLGFNGLCEVLEESTKSTVKHGYLTPETKELADELIDQLRKNGHKMEFLCVGNIPNGEESTEKVYEMLVAAPAFGGYDMWKMAEGAQINEIQFLCAYLTYKAQFSQAIKLAQLYSGKQVIFKATTPGLGAFGNKMLNIAKGFYLAAKEFENQLREMLIQVRLQVYQGDGVPRRMANKLKLRQF